MWCSTLAERLAVAFPTDLRGVDGGERHRGDPPARAHAQQIKLGGTNNRGLHRTYLTRALTDRADQPPADNSDDDGPAGAPTWSTPGRPAHRPGARAGR